MRPTRVPPRTRRSSFRDPFSGLDVHIQEEGEVFSYPHDWTHELNGDTIATATFEVFGGITIESSSNTATVTTAKISGTEGELKTTITTTNGGETSIYRQLFKSPNAVHVKPGYLKR